MRLWQLQRHWDGLARKDAYWAVLTDDDKVGGKWDREQFFATGRADVAADLAQVRADFGEFRTGHALDFGCGVGRLTQALADHFQQVTGVDISREMIARAGTENRHGARVNYVLNPGPGIALPGGPAPDFIYSRITLQHIAPRYSRRYIAEFMRLLAPGGVLLFQLPATVPPSEPEEQFKFSFWPPTLIMRIKRRIRRRHPGWFPDDPKMQMHALPCAEVEELLRSEGATQVSVRKIEDPECENYCYLARKAEAV